MTADEAIEEVLRLARDPALSDDELRNAVRAVIDQLPTEQRAAAVHRAQELLAQQRLH